MKRHALFLSALCFALSGVPLAADTPGLAPDAIVQNYCAAQQQAGGRSVSMEMDIVASIPAQKKNGRFHALRKINPFGHVSYAKMSFVGDAAVKNQVVERYLQAENEAEQEDPSSVAVTPANYKFQYKGENLTDGRVVHVFQISPKHKRKGLFKGELWIDAVSYLPLRESGNLAKSPSLFVKKVAFVRKFEIRDGISVPLQVQSVVSTVFGSAEITVDFTNFALSAGDEESNIR